MHLAWVVVLLAQAPVETTSVALGLEGSETVSSTASGDLLLEDLPLTDEELRLLDSLKATSTASNSAPSRIILDPALHVPRSRLHGRNARSVGEALREEATSFSTRRTFVSGESPVFLGRTGQRVGLAMDGLELRHALDSLDQSTALGLIDPWILEAVRIRRSAPLSTGGFSGHGQLSLTGRAPRARAGLTSELRGLGRLADRSSGFRGALDAGIDDAAISVSGGYSDHDPMRDGAGRHQAGTGDEESSLSSRARLWDAEAHGIQVDLGFDLFRVTNAKRFDLDGRIDRLRSMVSGFGRVHGGSKTTRFRLQAGVRRFETSTEPAGGGTRFEDDADVLQLDGELRQQLAEVFWLSAFGGAYTSGAYGAAVRGRMLRASGGVAAELEWETFSLRAAVRAGHAKSDDEFGKESAGVFVLPELKLGYSPLAHFTVLLGYQEAIHQPTVLDLSFARAALELEHARTVDLSFMYEPDTFGVRIGSSVSFVSNPVALQANVASNGDVGAVLGGELETSLRPLRGFELVVLFALTRGLGAEAQSFIEGGTAAARLRYELGVRGAYVELAARHAFPFPRTDGDLDPIRRRAWAMPFVSVGGGLELGYGFGLQLQVANAFDVPERELNSDIPRPGIDLRLALDHRFEL